MQFKQETSHATCLLARLYACAPPDDLRDGRKAVAMATRACELSNWTDWECLSVLAAAHAESGDFGLAVEWAAKTLELAPPEEKEERAARLRLYEAGQPHRLDVTPGSRSSSTATASLSRGSAEI